MLSLKLMLSKNTDQKCVMFITKQKIPTRLWKRGGGILKDWSLLEGKKKIPLNLVSGSQKYLLTKTKQNKTKLVLIYLLSKHKKPVWTIKRLNVCSWFCRNKMCDCNHLILYAHFLPTLSPHRLLSKAEIDLSCSSTSDSLTSVQKRHQRISSCGVVWAQLRAQKQWRDEEGNSLPCGW